MTDYSLAQSRFDELAAAFSDRKIMVIGDIGLDRYTIGDAQRLSQEAPVPVVAVERRQDVLGMAANVAANINSFNSKPSIYSLIGADAHGEELLGLMRESSIPVDNISSEAELQTTLKERVIAANQQIVRIDHEQTKPMSDSVQEKFWQHVESNIGNYDGVVIEDYSKGLFSSALLKKIIAKANSVNVPTFVDPPSTSHPTHLDSYAGCTMMCPNLKEAQQLTGINIIDRDSLYAAGNLLLKNLAAKVVIISTGKNGMTIFPKGEQAMDVPTFARKVYDVSGAGDTVMAMLSLAQLSGANLRESALLANYAAGVVVGKSGTATATIPEVREHISSFDSLK